MLVKFMQLLKKQRLFSVLVVCCLLPASLSAEESVLVAYDIEKAEVDSEVIAAEVMSGLEVTPLSRGPKLLPASLPGAFAANSWTTHSEPTDNRYFEFTVTPRDGTYSLSELVFAEVRAAKGPGFFVVKSSRDQFATPVGEAVELMRLPGRSDQRIVLDESFREITEPVTFRIYAYAAESGAGIWGLGNTSDGQPMRLLGCKEK